MNNDKYLKMYTKFKKSYKNPSEMKCEIIYALRECRDRYLLHSSVMLSEMLLALQTVPPYFTDDDTGLVVDTITYHDIDQFDNMEEYIIFRKACSYYEAEEYLACAHITEKMKNPEAMFLHYMSRYLHAYNRLIYERTSLFEDPKPLELQTSYKLLLEELLILTVHGREEDIVKSDNDDNFEKKLDDIIPKLASLDSVGRRKCTKKVSETPANKKPLTRTTGKVCKDPYLFWLTAVILKKLDRNIEAKKLLIKALEIQPCHWAAWLELSTLIKDVTVFEELELKNHPRHWMQFICMAQVYLDFQMTDKAIRLYNDILQHGHEAFQKWTYLRGQLAVAYHNKRDISKSVKEYIKVLHMDPFKLDNLELLSNLMYVCDLHDQLVMLCLHATHIDRYRQETLCILGNKYSLKCDHGKAVFYFKRALRLNPSNVTAWTLLGHEYIEMKNSYAAIASYRQALKINVRDYRAWYGLGQIYELVKLPHYAMYYFKRANKLRPHDPLMHIALGEIYERSDQIYEALICFYRALLYDPEGAVLLKLSRLYERYNDSSVNYIIRDNFIIINKNAFKVACRVKKEVTNKFVELALGKIYLYLGYFYLEQHNYERAASMIERHETRNPEHKHHNCELQAQINTLLRELESKMGQSTSTSSGARRFLFG
ncbi:cell division cycle protein 23 homolog [Adelges cooleyi]|uniref:cell division cycle protein 23 homolog n=1 Tax=Adelges cooleyi TaxID=133065 RepID=UPI0021803366|nr:cell division cycle protein 23 homolog [Adelges cooleyi]